MPVILYKMSILTIAGLALACQMTSTAFGQEIDREPPHRTAAFLGVNITAAGGLLEAQLLKLADVKWVERAQISKVIDEQKLQLLFDPKSVGGRVQLGHLLKADLLVLVRTGSLKNIAYLEVTVAEVARGLRITHRRIPISDKPDADAAQLLKFIEVGFAKSCDAIDALFCVPPFVSDDLNYEYDDLRGAYTRLIEAQLLEQPNTLVVELAEAEALTTELSLPTSDSFDMKTNKVTRKLPFYLVGRYRNIDQGSGRRVDIQLALKQGQQELARIKGQRAPEEVAEFLRREIVTLLKTRTGQSPTELNPLLEADLLFQSADEHLKLGGFEEAVSLAEACSLIAPRRADTHVVALRALSHLLSTSWNYRDVSLAEAQLAMSYYFRGVHHATEFFRNGGDLDRYRDGGQSNFMELFFGASNRLAVHPHCSPEVKKYMADVHTRNREAMLELVGLLIESSPSRASIFMSRGTPGLTEVQIVELAQELILRYQHLSKARAITRAFACRGYTVDVLDRPAGKTLLEALEKRGNEYVQAEVMALRRDVEQRVAEVNRERMEREQDTETLEPVPPGADKVTLQPIRLSVTGANGKNWEMRWLDGLLATSAGFDVAWAANTLYLMHRKGVLEPVFSTDAPNSHFSKSYFNNGHSGVCFDGSFVWAVLNEHQRDTRLVMIDPATKEVFEVTSKQGLPNPNTLNNGPNHISNTISINAIEPGRILVAGGFGRAWLAECVYTRGDGIHLRLFHEAKVTPEGNNREQWRDTSVSFRPADIFAVANLASEVANSKRFVVGRSDTNVETLGYPLIVDPSNWSVKASLTTFWSETTALQRSPFNNGVYFVNVLPNMPQTIALFRMGGPDAKIDPIVSLPREGYVLAESDRVHIVGQQWWIVDLPSKMVTPAGPVPWKYINHLSASGRVPIPTNKPSLQMLSRSNHYGIVAYYSGGRSPQVNELAQITFSK